MMAWNRSSWRVEKGSLPADDNGVRAGHEGPVLLDIVARVVKHAILVDVQVALLSRGRNKREMSALAI